MTAIINTKLATLLKKLEAAEATVTKIKADIAAIDKPTPAKGDEVSFVFGRGENKTTLAGTALKVSAGENGVAYVTVLVEIDGEPTTKRVPVKDVTIIEVANTPEQVGAADIAVAVQPEVSNENVAPGAEQFTAETIAACADHGSNVDALLAE